jgi:hypothetical protein
MAFHRARRCDVSLLKRVADVEFVLSVGMFVD